MSDAHERRAAALILVFAFCLFTFYSLSTPLFEASDELWHYPMVQHFATGGGLPVQRGGQTDAEAPWRQEGSQPPLYYWLAAAFSAPFDSSNWRELRRLNLHSDMGVPRRDGNANVILHTPAEGWPWRRAALAVRAARLTSILLSVGSVLFAYLVARELFPQANDVPSRSRSALRLAVPMVVACTPMFAFISGSVNNDNAAVLFSTAGTWWALRIMRTHDLSLRSAAIAGGLVGLGALSKSSALGLLGLLGFAAVLSFPLNLGALRAGIGALARWTLVMVAVAAALSGWWFVRNQALYGDWLGWNAFLDVVGRRDRPADLAQLWSEREGFVWAYWGVFGAMNVIMSPWIYDVLNGLAGVALMGLVWRALRHPPSPQAARKAVLGLFWVGLISLALLRWTSLTPASQGRLIFPCLATLSAALALGWWSLHRYVLGGSVAALAALAVAAPVAFIAPAYAPPPDRWIRALPLALDADFGGIVRLAQADPKPGAVARPGDAVELHLNWQVLAPPARNYSVFVHLVDEHDVIVAQRDMHPGQGRLALSEQPVGRRWSDFYAVLIPPLAPAPRTLRWAVGLYDLGTGERLRLADGSDRLIFGELPLLPQQSETPLLQFTNGVELLEYDFQPTLAAAGEVITVVTRWRAARQPHMPLSLSLQLLDEAANKIAQQDLSQPLPEWRTTQTTAVTHTLSVQPSASPGVYRLLLVWYDPHTFARVAAYDQAGQFAGDQITLTRIRVR
ncbi:MAG: hypothetical protein NZ693_06605 [Thermoflexales bacterium]|nr:hypothetical protein [Thermoflexales bacterium]